MGEGTHLFSIYRAAQYIYSYCKFSFVFPHFLLHSKDDDALHLKNIGPLSACPLPSPQNHDQPPPVSESAGLLCVTPQHASAGKMAPAS